MNPVYAVDWTSNTHCAEALQLGAASIQCLEPLFSNVVQAVAALAGVGLFIMLLSGGFRFLTSGGDQKKLEMARGTLTNAVVGIVLIAMGYLILRTIEEFTGVPITIFSLPTSSSMHGIPKPNPF